MKSALPPPNEIQRLAALASYGVLDTPYEPVFDAIVQLAGTICDSPIAVISLVDKERQWFKAIRGLPGVTQTNRDVAFCSHAILSSDLMEVPDATSDLRFHDNPLVTGEPKIRFYAGMPLRNDAGFALGTLCVIDRMPRRLNDYQRSMMAQLSTVVMKLLEARRSEARANQFGLVLRQSMGQVVQVDVASRRILDASSGFLKISGYSLAECNALTLEQLLARPAVDLIQDHLRRWNERTAEELVFETECRRRDGSHFSQLMTVTVAAGPAGEAQTLLCVGIDISERKRVEKELSDLVRERETLLREVYHRVKNNLQVIVSLLRLQIRTPSADDPRLALQGTADRVHAMALIHEMLYQSADLSSIPIDQYIRNLSDHLAIAAGTEARGIEIRLAIDPLHIPLDIAMSLALLINELISNRLKHAFPDGRRGWIQISLRQHDGKLATLEVADDGDPQASGESLGAKLVATLCRQLDGRLETGNHPGVHSRICFGLAPGKPEEA